MTITQLVEKLEALRRVHGDIPVTYPDAYRVDQFDSGVQIQAVQVTWDSGVSGGRPVRIQVVLR